VNKLTKDILIFTHLHEDINKIFLHLKNVNWEIWGRNNNDPKLKIGQLTLIKDNAYLFNEISFAAEKCITKYMSELNIDNTKYEYFPESIYIRKWDFPMKGMNPHRDYTYDEGGDVKPVAYTICGYLNDDYEGGLIEFPEHNISIKPPAGSAIIFPSHELHLVTDLVNKNRYMWSTFIFKKD